MPDSNRADVVYSFFELPTYQIVEISSLISKNITVSTTGTKPFDYCDCTLHWFLSDSGSVIEIADVLFSAIQDSEYMGSFFGMEPPNSIDQYGSNSKSCFVNPRSFQLGHFLYVRIR